MTVHLVVGAGEVGTAMHNVLSCAHDALIRDLNPIAVDADVLHICFPWSDSFINQVKGYVEEHNASLVVVHSTVPPGTCDPHEWVHSPVRGRHPDLAESLLTFIKHFGGKRAEEAAAYWRAMNERKTMCHEWAADTEAGKVWELIQYGLQIQVQKQIHAWCQANSMDFKVVYTMMALTYNEGYMDMGNPQFVRPVLTHMPGPIGGHCVTQMSGLIDHPLAKLVTDANS